VGLGLPPLSKDRHELHVVYVCILGPTRASPMECPAVLVVWARDEGTQLVLCPQCLFDNRTNVRSGPLSKRTRRHHRCSRLRMVEDSVRQQDTRERRITYVPESPRP